MPLLRLANGIEKKTDAKLVEFANYVVQKMTGNLNFPDPKPTLNAIIAATAELQQAMQDAGSGDRYLIEVRKAKKEALVDLMHLLGYYVVYASGGDRIKAASSGFPLVKLPVARVLGVPDAPLVKNGAQSGQLLVKTDRVTGAVAYLHQYTTDPEQKEESWMSMDCSAIKCTIPNLKVGVQYWLRVKAIGRKDQSSVGPVVTKVVA